MRWDATERRWGYLAAGAALAGAVALYPCTDRGSTAAAAIDRSWMTREQVAERLGTDGREDPDDDPLVAFSINPNHPESAGAVRRYMDYLASVEKRTYTGLVFTLTVSYSRWNRVSTAEVRNPTWNPRTWPGAAVGLLAAGAAGLGAAEARRLRRRWTEPPYPPADRCS